MLRALTIKNIAVIENVSIEFSDGFNILTGETGAGKSIIIDSLNMLRGARTPKTLIRNGEQRARVDGMFSLTQEESDRLAEEFGIEPDTELLISREITADGKGSARINGAPVPVSMLRSIGERLVSIHGQHDNTNLLSPKTHIRLLDSYGGAKIHTALEKYKELHAKCTQLSAQIDKIDINEQEAARRAEMLRYSIDEIDMSSLTVGEDEELESRKAILANSLKIAESTSKAYSSLYEGSDYERSAYDALWTAIKAIEGIASLDPAMEQAYSALSDAGDVIHENAAFLKNYCDSIDTSGAELDDVESRLELIHELKMKYSDTIEGILKKRDEMQSELDDIGSSGEKIEKLRAELAKFENERADAAKNLSDLRKKYAKSLAVEISKQLADLNMPNTAFDTVFTDTAYKSDGADSAEFVISANTGEALRPLASIASGGELARIMLAIKSILADSEEPTLMIFDEIDTGVSGAAAQKIGEKLWKLTSDAQVICITHLPQIAAMADSHYLIQKNTDGMRTRTTVTPLTDDTRVNETARMLCGDTVTAAAVENARELIRLAEVFKQNNR